MSMQTSKIPGLDGLWTYEIPGAGSAGVIVLVAGKLYGGDTHFFLDGDYDVDGESIVATITSHRYRDGAPQLDGPSDGAPFIMRGTWNASANVLQLYGPTGWGHVVFRQQQHLGQ